MRELMIFPIHYQKLSSQIFQNANPSRGKKQYRSNHS
jgi:hypothetical protein